ncbi:hypothetical protein LINPERHAP1_LOCUS15531, partial [Linum perenne]
PSSSTTEQRRWRRSRKQSSPFPQLIHQQLPNPISKQRIQKQSNPKQRISNPNQLHRRRRLKKSTSGESSSSKTTKPTSSSSSSSEHETPQVNPIVSMNRFSASSLEFKTRSRILLASTNLPRFNSSSS